MKISRLVRGAVFLFGISFLCSSQIPAQNAFWQKKSGPFSWQSLNGPNGEPISLLFASSAGDAFAAGQHYLYRSDNGSPSFWQNVLTPPHPLSVMREGKDGVLFAFTGRELYRSSDRGVQWNTVPLPDSASWNFDANASGGMVVTTQNLVWFSSNEGGSWSADSVPYYLSYPVVIFDDGTLLTTSNGVYRSNDTGKTWQVIPAMSQLHSVSAIVKIGPDSAMIAAQEMVYVSSNKFTTSFSLKTPDYPINAWTASSGNVYVLSDSSLYVCAVGSQSWRKNPLSPVATGRVMTVRQLNGRSDILIGYSHGVLRSTDDGQTWATANTGFSAAAVGDIAPLNNYLFAGEYRLRMSEGAEWKLVFDRPLRAHVAKGDTVIAGPGPGNWYGWYYGEGPPVPYTVDGGDHWSSMQTCISGLANTMAILGDGTLFTGLTSTGGFTSYGGICRSGPDATATRQQIVFTCGDCILRTVSTQGRTVMAVADSILLRSTDRGVSWHAVNQIANVWSVSAGKDQGVFAAAADGLYYSDNAGASWVHMASGLHPEAMQALDAAEIVLSDQERGLIYSADAGASWSSVSDGLPDSSGATAFGVDRSGYVYAVIHQKGVPQGVYRSTNTVTGIEQRVAEFPAAFNLAQNYPNPANPRTVIFYSIPRQGHVVVDVFNVLGQKVTPLVNEWQPAGTHSAQWDGSMFASGVYLCRLTAGGETTMRKMILVR